jgi:hypothetical protein
MNNQPVKLSDQLSLYSGDVITINNSCPLLVEIIDEQKQKIKLRNVKESKYLAKHSYTRLINKSLKFAEFDKSLNFIAKKNDNGKVSFQTADKYLDLNDDKFSLLDKVKWLKITKQENTENIANYQEEVEITELHQDRTKKIDEKTILIDCKSYDNKTANPVEHNFTFTEEVRKEDNFTYSKEITLGAKAKLSIATSVGLNISGNCEQKSTTSNSFTKSKTETIQESHKINQCPELNLLKAVRNFSTKKIITRSLTTSALVMPKLMKKKY